ncbi:hypothetical protein PVAG01_01084 [Phlyctema vagabunda]|uniref:DUF726-domain-containing protein n=1 Tax=Phlyctema vagabunda TaxID=108571 RepID=A0ABR4PW39_9HELO
MAPTSSDPHAIRAVLSRVQYQQALPRLVNNLSAQMRSGIEFSFESNNAEAANLFHQGDEWNESRHSGKQQDEAQGEDEYSRRLAESAERKFSKPKMKALERASLRYFDDWHRQVMAKVAELVNSTEAPPYTPRPQPTPARAESHQEMETRTAQEAKDVAALQELYSPLPTKFTTLSRDVRIMVLSSMLLLMLSLGHYSAHSRVLLLHLASSFKLPLSVLTQEEREVAQTLLRASKALNADAETQKRQEENKNARRWKVGLASVAGAAIIGITGGLTAPVVAGGIGAIMGGVGLGGVASFLGIFAMNGALVGTLFGAFGGKMTGEMVDAYSKEVEDFKFLPTKEEWGLSMSRIEEEEKQRRLRVTIGINGWLTSQDGIIKPWRSLGEDTEVFALRYELKALIELGTSLKSMVSSYAWSYVKLEILKRTVMATLWSALWPIYLLKMATSIDTPFGLARSRSEKAGQVLADALINKAQGERPVTLIGYSLGARVIYSCLKSLAERKAFGLVESVVLIGAPVPSNSDHWRVMRSVVSGTLTNVYSENDYILAFLYRATSIQLGVAGLQAIKGVEGVRNLDLSKDVTGHLRYPDVIPRILKMTGGFPDLAVDDSAIEKEDVEEEILLIDIEDTRDMPALAGDKNHTPPVATQQSIPKEIISQPTVDYDDDSPLQIIDNDPIDDDAPLQLVEAEPEQEEELHKHMLNLHIQRADNTEECRSERWREQEQKSLASLPKEPPSS